MTGHSSFKELLRSSGTAWNYRVVHHKDSSYEWYSLHEVYYDKEGLPNGMTHEPVSFVGETKDEVIAALKMALKDAEEGDVFTPPKEWQ